MTFRKGDYEVEVYTGNEDIIEERIIMHLENSKNDVKPVTFYFSSFWAGSEERHTLVSIHQLTKGSNG